jgi:hypothetical protein
MQDLAVWNIPDSELESRFIWTSQLSEHDRNQIKLLTHQNIGFLTSYHPKVILGHLTGT